MLTTSSTTKNKAAGAAIPTALNSETLDLKNTSVSNQQKIILAALEESAKTTLDLRNDYGIVNVAARISELRVAGYVIFTVRTDCYSPDGNKHKRVAKYVLLACPK